ncbi:molybdenum ABC transporter ATP-binding protein [Kordiimonas sp.]|uniref:molybdenum ABC transporter ATP-binding protein n=1 Tax=Kordiimonas sp. TaxID=1970157 RepID=UPI003A8F2E4D
MTPSKSHIDIAWRTGRVDGYARFSLSAGITALIGPSGAGKTTLTRLLAGLECPTTGTINLTGETVFSSSQRINLKAERRGIALVPQDSTLFPHLTLYQNITFACRIPEAELMALCEQAGIHNRLDAKPHTLSGGEARRAAIIRAVASKPKLLVLDEPLNGLDPVRRKDIMQLIRTLNRKASLPILMVTHQAEEMLQTADCAILMQNMHATVAGPLGEIFARPETAALLHLDDAGRLLSLRVSKRADSMIACDMGAHELWLPDDGEAVGSLLRLRILARDIAIARERTEGLSIVNQIECRLVHASKRRAGVDLMLVPEGTEFQLTSRITERSFKSLDLKEGAKVYALIKAVAVKELIAR